MAQPARRGGRRQRSALAELGGNNERQRDAEERGGFAGGSTVEREIRKARKGGRDRDTDFRTENGGDNSLPHAVFSTPRGCAPRAIPARKARASYS